MVIFMKKFISKKKISMPRYKLLFILFFLSIILIILINLFIKLSFKNINKEKFLNLFIGNSFGNVISNYNMFGYKYFIFYKNIFGFEINNNSLVSNENTNISEIVIDSKPVVYIYNTFQTDKYVNNHYNTYSINPVVTQASLILSEYLKKYNINSIVEKESVAKVLNENNIPYSLSYRGSRILLDNAKKNNNSLEYFFDLGLSTDNYNETTANVNNSSYAKILFIVGTDNPNYQNNQELAKNLNDKLINVNEKLSRGVSLRGGSGYHGVYNQDFSSNCLLIYIGGKDNTIDEVNRSLNVLANIFSDYLKEANNEKK